MQWKSVSLGALAVAAVLCAPACRGEGDGPPEGPGERPAAAARPTEAAPAPAPPPPSRDATAGATPEDVAPAPRDVPNPTPDTASDRTPDTAPRILQPFEIAAQLRVLERPRDVLDVFLTTARPEIRHAVLTEATRSRITAKGLAAFYAAAPGLLDLPLPLAPLSYAVQPVEAEGEGLHRFEVRLTAPAEGGGRSVAYYTLRDEADGPRVVWDRRDVAAARLLVAKGEYDGAEELARAVRKLSPYCGDCEEVIFWARSRREGGRKAWKGAGEHARRAVAWEPRVASHRNALGVYYRNMRQYERSREQLEKALALDPGSPAAGNLALLLEHQGEDEAALRLIDAYVAREPAELWPRLSRCRILRGLDRTEAAVAACEAAVERRQESDEAAHVAEAHYLLAGALKALGRRDEARAHAAKALEFRPGYWVYVKLMEELEGK